MTVWAHNAFGNDRWPVYNKREDHDGREPLRGLEMRKTLTTVRCVPRYGFEYAQVRTLDLDLLDESDQEELRAALEAWFAARGIPDALYDVAVDDHGFFAVINDEAYRHDWGEALL